MAISYTFYHDQNLVLTRAEGVLAVEEVIAHKQALLTDPEFHPDMRELTDARRVTQLQLTAADIWRITDIDRQHADGLGDYRIALVVPDDLHFGMARMYQQITEPHIAQVRVFRSLAEAAAWLDVVVPDDALSVASSPTSGV